MRVMFQLQGSGFLTPGGGLGVLKMRFLYENVSRIASADSSHLLQGVQHYPHFENG